MTTADPSRPLAVDTHLPRAPIGRLRSLLLVCSGTNRAVLDMAPTEIEARTGLGVAVVVPTILAAVGASITLANLGAAPLVVVLGAAALSALVFAVDRLMVTTPLTAANIVVRAVMTLALAWLVGEQLLLAAFAPEVESELAVVQAEELADRTETINAAADAELARLDARQEALTATAPGHPDAVASLAAAESELATARADLGRLQVQLREEISGTSVAGTTGRAGDGPVAAALRAEIDLATVVVDEATTTRDAASAALAELTAARTSVATDPGPELADLGRRRAEIETGRIEALDRAEAEVAAGAGIMARIEALERLATSPLMAAQVWALRLLLLAVDTLPLTVKLTLARRRDPYEELMDAYRTVEFARADAIAGRQPRPVGPARSPRAGSAEAPDGAADDRLGRRRPPEAPVVPDRRPQVLVGGELLPVRVNRDHALSERVTRPVHGPGSARTAGSRTAGRERVLAGSP